MNTKTSEVLDKLEQQKAAMLMVRKQIVMDLEDDARLEDIQQMYSDRAKDNLAKCILEYWYALRHCHPVVIDKHREVVDLAEGIYRLVK